LGGFGTRIGQAQRLPAASAQVLQQALPELKGGSTWIEMSTNDFAEIEALAAQAAAQSISTLA
jgi:3-hydroxyisobutyrate dehydrogenase-like beta-hydroxyacid dehydrogenase